ncbi:MAG: phenylalanine--tRNA ligase subunit beta [Planctomycetota bacterium]
MRVPYSEIIDSLSVNLSIEEIAQILNEIGLPVENIEKFEDDTIFEIEVPSNRPDLLAVYEVIKQIAIYLGLPLPQSALLADVPLKICQDKDILEVINGDFAPLYFGLICKVRVKESDNQFQKRLTRMGFTPINNIVDTTNFICAYFGQPMHSFDYSKVKNGKLVVRKSVEGERFIGLDEKPRILKQGCGVIADSEKILALAGIIGSANSATTFHSDTIFLECAHFNFKDISYASKNLGIETESSYRFKRKVPYNFTRRALNAFLNLLKNDVELLKTVKYENIKEDTNTIEISFDFINRRLGMSVPAEKIIKILSNLECKIIPNDTTIIIYPPKHRGDIKIKEDIVEEIARFIGYKNIKNETTLKITKSTISIYEERLINIKKYLADNSFVECISTSFLESRTINKLELNKDIFIPVNALKNTGKFLRTTILFPLLDVYKINLSFGFEKINIFEIGKVFKKEKDNFIEREKICLISNYFDAKNLKNFVENIFEITGDKCIIENSDSPFFINSFSIKQENRVIGYGGEIKKNILNAFEIKYSKVWGVEFDIENIMNKSYQLHFFNEIPAFSPMKIDVSFILNKDIEYATVKEVLSNIKINYLVRFELIDVFVNRKIGEDKKSYTIRLYFQHNERNLEKKEIQPIVEDILNELKKKFAVIPREG